MSALNSEIGGIRNFYQRRFEDMAVQGNNMAAFIDFVGLQLLIPESGEQLGGEILMSVVPYGKVGKLAKIATRNVDGGKTTARAVLKNAERWLGPGYREIAPGVFRSADGTRQFRMRDVDLGASEPHVHFESIGSGGRLIQEGSHTYLVDP